MKRIAILLLLLPACARVGADPKPPPAAAVVAPPEAQKLPVAHVDVEAADGRAFGLQVELALNDDTRERGLMFRKSLADGAGMLFIFTSPGPHNFWMKNTLIPLDMIFAAEDGRVLGCVERAEPLTL